MIKKKIEAAKCFKMFQENSCSKVLTFKILGFSKLVYCLHCDLTW